MIRRIVGLTALAVVLAAGVAPAQEFGPKNGSLVIVGGGGVGPDILAKFIELAGGPDASIVVIPTAGGGEEYGQDWRGLGGIKRAVTKKRRLAIVPRDEGEEEHATASRKSVREDAVLYDKVDAVLDKISAEGMSALTEAELALLDEVSKKHRTN